MKKISPLDVSYLALAAENLGAPRCTIDQFPVKGRWAKKILLDLLGPQRLPESKALVKWAETCRAWRREARRQTKT